MRAKRPRSVHGATQNHNGHSRTRSMSEDNLGDDSLLHMDPSLMTERQQLAFLLRKTAQEQSGADSNATHSSESSEDEAQPKRSKKRIQRTWRFRYCWLHLVGKRLTNDCIDSRRKNVAAECAQALEWRPCKGGGTDAARAVP
jgi:hypothetical protein